jgi:membrane-bound lytic murein transglycosylase B
MVLTGLGPAVAQSVIPVQAMAAEVAAALPGEATMPFEAWREGFRRRALSNKVTAATFDRAFATVEPDLRILQKFGAQPEHERPLWEYIDGMLSVKRVSVGQAKLNALKSVLDAVEGFYGVPREVLIAVWGIETSYGTNLGDKNIIRSLATLAWGGGRRARFGEQQLLAALRIVQDGDVPPEAMTGSWAGAMGHTQFIPTTYLQYAVDFDKDGRRDIWSDYFDALGSTANYLVRSGWKAGEPWGVPVTVPGSFDFTLAGVEKSKARPLEFWERLGVRRSDGQPFRRRDLAASLILPVGAKGPALLVFANFRAILRYNSSTAYALAVGQLSDILRGQPPAELPWPRAQRPLAREERQELQRLLGAGGYGVSETDGLIGSKTREALRTFQRAKGLPADGFPSPEVLERLRSDGPS